MEFIIKAVVAFLATNLEEMVLIIIFFGSGRVSILDVFKGQYIGFLIILLLSLIGSAIGHLLDKPVVSLFGLLVIYTGLLELWEYFNLEKESSLIAQPDAIKTYFGNQPVFKKYFPEHLAMVASCTLGMGADNLGVYIPIMAPMAWYERLNMVFLFLSFNFLLLVLSYILVNQKRLAIILEKAGRVGKPLVLIALGSYLLYNGNVWSLLKRL